MKIVIQSIENSNNGDFQVFPCIDYELIVVVV